MRVLLVDDERAARSRLARLLRELGGAAGIDIVGEAANGPDALEAVASLKPDVVFLDIEMPGLSGIEVAAALPSGGPQIVFATAYDDFAVKAFEANAVDYLVKPVESARLQKTLERLHAGRSAKVERSGL